VLWTWGKKREGESLGKDSVKAGKYVRQSRNEGKGRFALMHVNVALKAIN